MDPQTQSILKAIAYLIDRQGLRQEDIKRLILKAAETN